jgi:hypothetical protein
MVHGRPPEPDHSLTPGLGGMEVAMVRLGTFPKFEGSVEESPIVGHAKEFHTHSLKALNGTRSLPFLAKSGGVVPWGVG